MFLSDRIRALAPGNATHFRLKLQSLDGNIRVFPPEENAFYRLGDSPYGIPSGRYLLCFYDEEQRSLGHCDQMLLVNLQNEVHKNRQAQLSLNLSGGGGAANAATVEVAPSQPAAATPAPPSPAAPAAQPMDAGVVPEDELEFRRHLHVLDLEERQQDFIRNSTYVKEVGEHFLLNRLMRREMMEMQRNMVLHAKEAFRDLAQIRTAVHELMEMQNSVIAHVEKHQKHPPPPPPDYVGLGHSALALLKDVSVALVQRWPGPGGARAAQPQLSAASTPPAPAQSPPSSAAPPAEALDRMSKRLRALSELELAQALSSPESWKELLDSFRDESTAPSTEPDAAPGPTAGLEG